MITTGVVPEIASGVPPSGVSLGFSPGFPNVILSEVSPLFL